MELIAALGIGLFGFIRSRRFVRERLRFVDAAHKSSAPVVAGVVTTLAAAPVVWVLPVLGGLTAVVTGIAVGAGVSAGSKDTKALPGG